MGPMMQGNASNLPQATEYTLQGVMRFLQTEWHRHERDRNAWEIEKQEMKGRIANLEGQARRADATQRALKKYVSILERKVKDQKGSAGTDDAENAKNLREAKIREKLKCEFAASVTALPNVLTRVSATLETHTIPGVDGVDGELKIERGDEESQRQDLKTFLDQCQSEFMYLMITPANPQPPRDSPPLPMMEDLREVEGYGMPAPQPIERQFQLPSRPVQNHVQEMNSRAPPPTTPRRCSPTRSSVRNTPSRRPRPWRGLLPSTRLPCSRTTTNGPHPFSSPRELSTRPPTRQTTQPMHWVAWKSLLSTGESVEFLIPMVGSSPRARSPNPAHRNPTKHQPDLIPTSFPPPTTCPSLQTVELVPTGERAPCPGGGAPSTR